MGPSLDLYLSLIVDLAWGWLGAGVWGRGEPPRFSDGRVVPVAAAVGC